VSFAGLDRSYVYVSRHLLFSVIDNLFIVTSVLHLALQCCHWSTRNPSINFWTKAVDQKRPK